MRKFVTNTISAVASIAFTAGLIAFADPATADTGTISAEQPVTVRTGDLALGSADGRATALRRIHLAADRVCPADAGHVDFAALRCRQEATHSAETALDRIAAR